MSKSILLNWVEKPPQDLDQLVIKEIIKLDISHPSNLIFHIIRLTKNRHGPSVLVYGEKNSDEYFCKYCAETKLVTFNTWR